MHGESGKVVVNWTPDPVLLWSMVISAQGDYLSTTGYEDTADRHASGDIPSRVMVRAWTSVITPQRSMVRGST